MEPSHHYRAFGMRLRAPFLCPELTPDEGPAEVTIRDGEVPAALEGAQARGVRFEATADRFLLRVDGIARYLAVGGREVILAREPGASDEDVRLFLLGSVFGALLHQRGLLPLHGSAIEVAGGAVAFVGPSGVGKSTIAAALARRGYRVMADDVTPVSLEGGAPTVLPGYPQLKIWADSAEKLGERTEELRRVRTQLEKYGLPVGELYCATPVPLRRVYVLSTTNTRELSVVELKGMEKVTALLGNTYRLSFLGEGPGRAPNFEHCAAVAERAVVSRVTRPEHPFLLEELAELLHGELSRS